MVVPVPPDCSMQAVMTPALPSLGQVSVTVRVSVPQVPQNATFYPSNDSASPSWLNVVPLGSTTPGTVSPMRTSVLMPGWPTLAS